MGIQSDLESLKAALEAGKSHVREPMKCELILVTSQKAVDRLLANYVAKKQKWAAAIKELQPDGKKLKEAPKGEVSRIPRSKIDEAIRKSGGGNVKNESKLIEELEALIREYASEQSEKYAQYYYDKGMQILAEVKGGLERLDDMLD